MKQNDSFYNLDPSHVLNSVEDGLDIGNSPARRCTGRLSPLNSIENRVYALDLEDGTELVAKFYRPGRWTEKQIAEEHLFLGALHQADLSVIQPLELERGLSNCPTLGESDQGIYYAVFPRSRARLKSELLADEVPLLGRLIARMHIVARNLHLPSRLKLNTKTYGREPLAFLKSSTFAQSPMGQRYVQTVEEILPFLELRLKDLPTQIVHGDCHVGNILWEGDRPFLTDFDDCVHAPIVQDFWLITQGRDEASLKRRDALIDSYEEISSFDWDSLDAVEALRALRMIHYSAWVARRWEDPSFPKIFPNFASDQWWREEIEALMDCYEHLNS